MGLGLDVPPSSLGGVFVNAVVRGHNISFSNSGYDYRKVVNFRLLVKGIFDTFIL